MSEIPYRNAAKEIQYPQKVSNKIRAAFSMGDQPTEQLGGWLGYFHQQDPTTYSKDNLLTYPSVNCFIPFRDKIIPRLGTEILGAPFTNDWGCVGHMKKYGTMSGIETEIRVTKSNDIGGDILEIWCPDFIGGVKQTTFSWKRITLNTNPLPQGTHEYYFDQWFDTDLDPSQALNLPRAIWVNGNKQIFSWTGGIAPIINVIPGVSITTIAGTSWESLGFVDPAFDSSLSGTININGLSYTVTGGWETDTLLIANTTGISVDDVAFSEIQSNETPVNISGTITHGALVPPPNPPPGLSVFQNGEMVVGNISGATAFITIDQNSGAGPMLLYGVKMGPNSVDQAHAFTVGETITGFTSKVVTDVITYTQTSYNQLVFDVCKNYNGYMYYGSWNAMKVYQSNQFNKSPTQYITSSQAVQNDLVIGTTDYTGTGQNVYRVTIDSVNPNIDTQTFSGTGPSDATWDTSNYDELTGITNVYKISMMADTSLVFATTFATTNGETVTSSPGGSGAIGQVITNITDSGVTMLGIKLLTPQMFTFNETVIFSTTVGTKTLTQAGLQNWIQGTKNNIVFNLNTGFGGGPLAITPLTTSIIDTAVGMPDHLTIQFTNFKFHTSGDVFTLTMNEGGHDTFKWQINGGTPIQTGVAIQPGIGTLLHGAVVGGPFHHNERVVGATSGAFGFMDSDSGGKMILHNPEGLFKSGETITGKISGATTTVNPGGYTVTGVTQFLNNGISLSFVLNTGHTLGDFWEITATQGVGGNNPTLQNQQAFANFYYTLPDRIPGEGYIYSLGANFWAMSVQETELYVCNNYGNWSFITTNTHAAPTGTYELISITPLKQTGSSKPIYPYMISYMNNDIVYVTTDKTLDFIGRQQLLQLPRIDNLSHPVQLDFDVVSFTGGSMEYFGKRLYINSPKEGVMFCYDNHPENKYWQPPQMIPENGILSVINENGRDVLISHSPFRNQSWKLYSGQNGDNGGDYLVRARTPYLSKGNRWQSKSANMTFCEGYKTGNPPMVQTLIKEINGCGGTEPHKVVPVVCTSQTTAPFGMGHFGSHPNGSDIFALDSYFKEIYPYQQTQNFYFAALEMSCLTTNHSYEWLTLGMNSVIGTKNNIEFKNQQKILPV